MGAIGLVGARRRTAPGGAARPGRRGGRADAGRPGAGRRRRVRAVRAGHRRPAAARAALAGRAAPPRAVPAGLAEALAVPAAAQVACGPVIAGAVRHGQPGRGAGEPAGGAGRSRRPRCSASAAAVLSPVWPAGAEFAGLAGALAGPVAGRGRARTARRVPAGALPWPGGVAGGAAARRGSRSALLVAARRPIVRRLVAVVARRRSCSARCRCGCSRRAGRRPAGWSSPARSARATRVVLPAGAGRAVVVDAGPDPDAGRPAACAGSAYGRWCCSWSATSTSTTSAASPGVFRGRDGAAPWSRPTGRSRPAAGRRRRQAAARGVPVARGAAGRVAVRGRRRAS